jgi:hypothetical protein
VALYSVITHGKLPVQRFLCSAFENPAQIPQMFSTVIRVRFSRRRSKIGDSDAETQG